MLVGRRSEGRHAGLWEFPGGKLAEGEAAPAALARELAEELGVKCMVGALVGCASDERIMLSAYQVDTWEGTPQAVVHAALRWVEGVDLTTLQMPEVDRQLLRAVQQLLS